jgi:hypothetical protein
VYRRYSERNHISILECFMTFKIIFIIEQLLIPNLDVAMRLNVLNGNRH